MNDKNKDSKKENINSVSTIKVERNKENLKVKKNIKDIKKSNGYNGIQKTNVMEVNNRNFLNAEYKENNKNLFEKICSLDRENINLDKINNKDNKLKINKKNYYVKNKKLPFKLDIDGKIKTKIEYTFNSRKKTHENKIIKKRQIKNF